MNENEFKTFMKMIDDQYPNQPKFNQTQKGFFWLALKDFNITQVVSAFSLHTQDSEKGMFKPQVCEVMKYLQTTNMDIRSKFQEFFDHKEVKDKLAISIWNKIGGNRLLRLTEKEVDKKAESFLELYKQEIAKEKLENLPKKIKQKLIGVEDKSR